jgi:hypothetical protein
MRLPTEDDLTPKKFVTEDGASRRNPIQHHLETLADRLKEAYQVEKTTEFVEKGGRSITT